MSFHHHQEEYITVITSVSLGSDLEMRTSRWFDGGPFLDRMVGEAHGQCVTGKRAGNARDLT